MINTVLKHTLIMLTIMTCVKSTAFDAEKTELSLQDIITMPILDPSCHHYCITGVCVWLRCNILGCEIETSLRVRHYNPDLIVSVYDKPGDNPWQEAEALFGQLEKSLATINVNTFHPVEASGGHRTEGGNMTTNQSLRYKEVTAIGHPMALLSDYFSGAELLCPSEATPFTPYFSSGIDAISWRLGLLEMLYLTNLLPGVRIVGEGGLTQQWGPVWPRTGFILQKDDVKAAAVIAQRVGNIVTRLRQPHIYTPLNGNGYNRTWLPGELIENRENTGVWQMLVPKQDEQCYVFGENDVLTSAWSEGRQSDDYRYAFSLWRPYECCGSKGSYLFTVPLRVCL